MSAGKHKGGSHYKRNLIFAERWSIKGSEEHAFTDVHLQQDKNHVQTDVRMREQIRRTFVELAGGAARNEDKGSIDEIHKRRDRQLRL